MTRAALLLGLATALPAALAAQVPDSLRPDSLRVDSVRPIPRVEPAFQDTTPRPLSPGGAMLRSVLLPGWGQSEFEAYFRGSIYFAGWAGNWFMNFRNAHRLEEARSRYETRAEQIEEEIIAGSTNPDSMQAQLDSFPDILDTAIREDETGNDLRKLVRAREQQREDWIAWSLFWLLASGVDAFVTAHLADFPAEVELRPTGQRAATLTVSVPIPTRASRPAPQPAALPPPPLDRPQPLPPAQRPLPRHPADRPQPLHPPMPLPRL